MFLLIFIIFIYLFVGKAPKAEKIIWAIDFSQKHALDLGLDWKETYQALIQDLGAKDIRINTHWDLIEPQQNQYYFEDLDWQIQKAEEEQVKVLLVIGMKTPRWPECHLPDWAKSLNKEQQQQRILKLIEEIVKRYEDMPSIVAWQAENEPFLPFGNCPWSDQSFVKKEVELIKALDSKKREVLISESGEFSFWIKAAKLGDIVGTTMYRRVWSKELNIYTSHIFPPVFYWRKAQLIKKLFNKKVVCIELQAEPWGPKLLYDSPLQEQEKTMDLKQFKKNIEFAKKTGLDTFYLWGGEWWYWMKQTQSKPEIWNEVKTLF